MSQSRCLHEILATDAKRLENTMEEYKRINRTLIAHGSILDYYQDTIRIPNGTTARWDFISNRGAAAVLPVKEDGKIILVRQYRNALDKQTLEIPAGKLDAGENPYDAAVRELREETGCTAAKITAILSINPTVAFCNEQIDIYLATGLKPGKQDLDDDEFLNVEEYTLEEILNMIDRGEIMDSKTVSAVLKYALMNANI